MDLTATSSSLGTNEQAIQATGESLGSAALTTVIKLAEMDFPNEVWLTLIDHTVDKTFRQFPAILVVLGMSKNPAVQLRHQEILELYHAQSSVIINPANMTDICTQSDQTLSSIQHVKVHGFDSSNALAAVLTRLTLATPELKSLCLKVASAANVEDFMSQVSLIQAVRGLPKQLHVSVIVADGDYLAGRYTYDQQQVAISWVTSWNAAMGRLGTLESVSSQLCLMWRWAGDKVLPKMIRGDMDWEHRVLSSFCKFSRARV